MIYGKNKTTSGRNLYKLDSQSNVTDTIDESVPYFIINGHNFRINTNAESKSEINLVKNKMYVPGKSWGYTDIQWTNFTGETLTVEIYSRVTDTYTGDHVQPEHGGGIENIYSEERTPHAILKYWAQMFVVCTIKTNIDAFESGNYVIDEFSQTNPDADFVVSKVTFIQYERPGEIEQTYSNALLGSLNDSSGLNAQTTEITELGYHTQGCFCTPDTEYWECTASYNEEVEIIQKYLQQWGYFPKDVNGEKVEPNGKFCYYTTQALSKFQEDRGIEVTGNFDEMTKSHFMKKLEGI